jgi:hypothetical protein
VREFLRRSGAGLEQASQFCGREIAAAGLGLTAHRLHVDGQAVLVHSDEPGVPALL